MDKKNWLIALIVAVVILGLGMLTNSIMEHKAESEILAFSNNSISPFESRNALWGEAYPRECQSLVTNFVYYFHSKYLGSNSEDVLAQRPEMVIIVSRLVVFKILYFTSRTLLCGGRCASYFTYGSTE